MQSSPAPSPAEAARDPTTKATALLAARAALPHFEIDGALLAVEPHERGHIHNTFISTWKQGARLKRFLHQQLNDRVFTDIPGLMQNVERVTRHLRLKRARRQESDGFETLSLVPARGGGSFLRDATGYWRTYHFIDDTESFDLCQGPEQAFEAARAFGAFQEQLIDLDVGHLRETLPGFFSTPHRWRQFEQARAQASTARTRQAAPEIAFALARRAMVHVIHDHMMAGRIPSRVVHGDTKLNNVLFDRKSGTARCIVDLDTCMPGYSLYDFGDLVRFTAATSREDETDLDKAGMDIELYRALVQGYLENGQHFLGAREIELMPFAARLVTLTIGLRFLTDHLAGDVYFKTSRPGHNLDRARVQFAMVASMEQRQRDMEISRSG